MHYFLECAKRAWASTTPAHPPNDLVTDINTNMRDVLRQLTDALSKLFTPGRVQTIIESTYLNDVMQELRGLDDTSVEECITDELVSKTLNLAETLTTATGYYDNCRMEEVQWSARVLKANIARVKAGLGAT